MRGSATRGTRIAGQFGTESFQPSSERPSSWERKVFLLSLICFISLTPPLHKIIFFSSDSSSPIKDFDNKVRLFSS